VIEACQRDYPFDVGDHSPMAMRLAVSETTGLDVPVRSILRKPTVSDITPEIEALQAVPQSTATFVQPA
jgi:hypothetical protein